MHTLHVSKLGTDHTQWAKDLNFYKDELKIFEHRLSEVVQKNTKQDVLARVEHFQNQFLVQRNNIDWMQHNIHENLEKAAIESLSKLGHINEERMITKIRMEEEIKSFENNFANLKHEFLNFLAKVF